MGKKDFCSPEKLSVIIPYKDYEKLVKAALSVEDFEATLKRIDERNAAMHQMYVEILEKVAELNRLI